MLRKAETLALLLVIVITALVLCLWFSPRLATAAPPIWSEMRASTALGLLCVAGGFALSEENPAQPWLRVSQAVGFVVLVLSLPTLTEYTADVSLGIDAWLPAGHLSRYPGHSSPQASVGFALLGTSLLMIRESKGARSLLADLSTGALVAFCFVMVAGYAYGATNLSGSTPLAPQTLFCFSCLAFVAVELRAERSRLFAVLIDMGVGSRILRVLLPIAILLRFTLFAAVIYLINSRTMPAPYVYASAAAGASFFVLCAIAWMAQRINTLERQLHDLSLHDELTKLYNRRGFYLLAGQAFREAARANSGMTLLFFDLDGLKRVNDTAGHEAGSKLIQAYASRLVETFRESDIIGRVGGDEFAVSTVVDRGKAGVALARLDRSVRDFNSFDLPIFPLRFSVGLAEMVKGGSETFEELVARADAMMYQDKKARHVEEPPTLISR